MFLKKPPSESRDHPGSTGEVMALISGPSDERGEDDLCVNGGDAEHNDGVVYLAPFVSCFMVRPHRKKKRILVCFGCDAVPS